VVAGFIWITVRAVGYLRRNNLFDAKPLLMLALISPCMAVGYVAMLNLGQFSFQNLLNHDMLLILSMFVPLIFLPILTTPGAMHWCRHRK
jgi:hypothetical protein